MKKFLSRESVIKLIRKLQAAPHLSSYYDAEKHRLVISDLLGTELFILRLPITLTATAFTNDVLAKHPVSYVILLIQSGSCALGYFEDGFNIDHKVIRAYMVRKKQGMSQLKYLKTKGKSRAGSRVRLGESAEFFENINGRLQSYFERHEIHRIAISCSKTLLPYLYNAKVNTPFNKKDPRIYKIPIHVHTPIYEILLDINKYLLKGELIYKSEKQPLITELLRSSFSGDEEE